MVSEEASVDAGPSRRSEIRSFIMFVVHKSRLKGRISGSNSVQQSNVQCVLGVQTTTTSSSSSSSALSISRINPPSLSSSASASSSSTTSNSSPTAVASVDEPLCLKLGTRADNPDKTPASTASTSSSSSARLLGEKYLMLDSDPGTGSQCLELSTGHIFVCKTASGSDSMSSLMLAHHLLSFSSSINRVEAIVRCPSATHVLFNGGECDLHSFVRARRRLRETQARRIFGQVVTAVADAHRVGLVLRDLKLRKFILIDNQSLETRLESLSDSVLLEDPENDLLSEKHGCPAYVSPEILRSNVRYSGRAADMWSLGVMLYTMLVGRYPFHGQEHTGLFAKIRRGHFSIPECVSSRAKCLIRCLLRKDPTRRLTADEVLQHPFLRHHHHLALRRELQHSHDQCVPSNISRDGHRGKRATTTTTLSDTANINAMTIGQNNER